MLPDRLLRCTLGRITNFDPHGYQQPSELHYEGRHEFALFLPAIPVRTTEPPDPVYAPEPVDPATRVVADPDGVAAGPVAAFDRVVDYWPDRVELTRTVRTPLVTLIIVHPIDSVAHSANLFLTRATDMTAFDPQHIYQGNCSVAEGAAARR